MPSYRTAFISHAHADNARCAHIAALLRTKGIDLWIDLDNAQKAHTLSTEITRELLRRQTFVLMVTPTADASPWVAKELSQYLAFSLTDDLRMVGGQRRLILPVRLEPVRIKPDAEDSNWAKVLDLFWIDGVGKSDEQIADEIAFALALDGPPPPPWEEIPIAADLYTLGLRGWRVRKTGVEFILPPTCDVAAGAFLMGSDARDKQAYDNEKPQYRMPVDAFAIGAYPVTVAEYAYYLKANPQIEVPQGEDDDFYGWKQQQTRPGHPVVQVTWYNVFDYAVWLAKTTGQPWRLPTEAEWEKAARWDEAKQVSRIYPWGDTWDKMRANTSDGGPKRTTPIGSYPSGASPSGAQDMAGNVWEWTASAYAADFSQSRLSVERDSTENRVLRGGSWDYAPWGARAAYRLWGGPGGWSVSIGFRLVRAAGAGAS